MSHTPQDTGSVSASVADSAAVVLERFAEELVFLRPGAGDGLLPLNALLMELEELSGWAEAPEAALAIARRWIDAVLDGSGLFLERDIQNLQAWTHWFLDYLVAAETGRPQPPLPIQWRQAPERPMVEAAPAPVVEGNRQAAAGLDEDDGVPSLTLRLPDDYDLLREFHSESLELLQGIERSVLALEDGSASEETVHSIFRAFHTFKGSAGFLQLDPLRDFAHRLESLLDEVRAGRLAIGPPVVAAVLAGSDVLAACMVAVGAQVTGVQPVQPIPLPGRVALRLVERALRGDSAGDGASEAAAPAANSVSGQTSLAQAPATPSAGPLADQAESFVRVDAGKLDALVNLVGELVITQAFVLDGHHTSAQESLELGYAMRKLNRITRDLQHATLSMRMVPVATLFRRMGRLVRDLSAGLGKQARLVVQGEDTELDRHLVERIADPLVHMIRNALDHGVEMPEVRRAAGKDPVATLRLTATHAHGGVRIEIGDDGRGIDVDSIRAKALALGLIAPDDRRDNDEALRLIFQPGFTTAASVTEISGRGVGMDVVKRHIDDLRGHVGIQTTLGSGTTFTVRLPLTLSQIDGFLVRSGTERYILASASVRECHRAAEMSVFSVHERGEMVTVRGTQLPLLRLAVCLGHPRSPDVSDGVVVVLETAAGERAVLVDEVLGKQEVIIKNLGEVFSAQSLVGGGAILADGRVALVLDAETLVRMPSVEPSRRQQEVA